MPSYTVTWEIDIDADTPEQAAYKAQRIQQDPESTATVFEVHDPAAGLTLHIDTDDDVMAMDVPEELPEDSDIGRFMQRAEVLEYPVVEARDYDTASDVPPTAPDDSDWTPR